MKYVDPKLLSVFFFWARSTITNRYIKGGHSSIQIQVSDLEKNKNKKHN